jgi:hypothetical protein
VKDRLSEITFGTPLRAELHSLALAQAALAGVTDLPPTLARLRDARIHMISPDETDAQTASAALHPSWPLLTEQRKLGHRATERWIADHQTALGRRSSFALDLFVDKEVAAPRLDPSVRQLLQGAAHAT